MEKAIYLGDAVYAQRDDRMGGIILTTGSHILTQATNTIFLEAPVLENLNKWLSAMKRGASKQAEVTTTT